LEVHAETLRRRMKESGLWAEAMAAEIVSAAARSEGALRRVGTVWTEVFMSGWKNEAGAVAIQ
jgi:hypothetical protein